MAEYTPPTVHHLIQDELDQNLEGVLREGARKMLTAALEMEVDAYIERCKEQRDEAGHRQVVRNGHHPARDVVTGVGKIPIHQPRVHDRRSDHHFTSAILPPYLRRTSSIDALIPALYLKGVSTSQCPEALSAILGEGVSGLSSANIVRLQAIWERDLTGKHYVYIWVDGIYFKVRLAADRPCVLVVIGATQDGRKELIALEDGQRESKRSWQAVLQDLKARGLTQAPAVAIGDGGLGFWAALREDYPATKAQRCWVHKTANALDKLPNSQQPKAKELIHQIYGADTKEEALGQYDRFIALYEAKYPKSCHCLQKDKDALFTFYDFPAHHWRHLRTTNPIESTFATVRHRTRQTKGCGSRKATLMMVYKLATEAEKKWQRLHGYKWLEKVIEGVEFVDGVMKKAA
ncbi:MAG: IS256 family transposase [Candidatus Latescibacteria bacterium]|nr:IS256 family transposase [Candidatus Latescibacterota bacterium]